MTGEARSWSIRLTASAESDFRSILDWTLEQFGPGQTLVYARTLSAALAALTAGPTAAGVKERADVAKGLFTLHVAQGGRKGRHFVLFRVSPEKERCVDVLRLLHDAMDLSLHVSGADNV